MTRTRGSVLVVLAVAGTVGAFLLQLVLGALGAQKFVPEVSLSITLALIAVVIVALAVPVRQATRAERPRRVDPFYATRVLLLAKASAVAGALLAGVAAGLVIELLVRPVWVTGSLWRMLGMLAAAIVLLVAGLVAETLCMLPPDDDESDKRSDHAPA